MKRFVLLSVMFIGSATLGVYLFTTPGCACLDILPKRIYDLNVLNPIRDRSPELAAQSFLQEQGKGKCRPVASELCGYALSSHAVLDSRLVARHDSGNHVVLYYRVKAREQGYPNEFWGQAEIEAKRIDNTWRVTSYSAVY